MNPFFKDTALPQFKRLGHEPCSLLRGHSLEANAAATIGVRLNNVDVLFFIGTCVPNFTARKFVKLLDRRLRDRELRAPLVNNTRNS